ncbi:MAG: hypothetical protein V1855_02760 [bacterium]
MKKTSYFLIGIGFIGLIGTLFFYAQRRSAYYKKVFSEFLSPNGKLALPSNHNSEMVMYGLCLREVQTKNGQEQYKIDLKAKEGSFSSVSDLISCKDVACTVTAQEKVFAWFNAEAALINRLTKQVFFQKKIVGRVQDFDFVGTVATVDIAKNVIEFKRPFSCKNAVVFFKVQEGTFDMKNKTLSLAKGVQTEFSQGSTGNNSRK